MICLLGFVGWLELPSAVCDLVCFRLGFIISFEFKFDRLWVVGLIDAWFVVCITVSGFDCLWICVV